MLEHGISMIALLDMDADEGPKAQAELSAAFPSGAHEIIFEAAALTNAETHNRAVARIAAGVGRVDVLVAFAAIVRPVRAADYTPEHFRKILDVNTTGTFLAAQAVGREMIARGTGGSIIMCASISGNMVNFPQLHVAYGTSKAAVQHMARCLAGEWAGHGIRVNSLSPGYMDTRLNAPDELDWMRKVWLERTPMGRMGRPEEVVGPVMLLASEAGSFMTGADLRMDGGYSVF